MHLQLLRDLGDHLNFTIASKADSASGSLDMNTWHSHGQAQSMSLTSTRWSTAAVIVQLIQDCGVPGSEACESQFLEVLLLLVFLSASLLAVIFALACFAETRGEDDITPLCPHLVVKEAEVTFTFPLDEPGLDTYEVVERVSKNFFKVSFDWPDPFKLGPNGIVATARLQNSSDGFLATVVARNVSVAGQSLALCRAGCEIFGFVEPDGPQKYHVRHRTGLHLLTLWGDFATLDVIGINPANVKVCWFRSTEETCTGKVLQHVDAGLVISSLLATRVHRRLKDMLAAPDWPLPSPNARRGSLAKLREDAPETPTELPEMQEDVEFKPLWRIAF